MVQALLRVPEMKWRQRAGRLDFEEGRAGRALRRDAGDAAGNPAWRARRAPQRPLLAEPPGLDRCPATSGVFVWRGFLTALRPEEQLARWTVVLIPALRSFPSRS